MEGRASEWLRLKSVVELVYIGDRKGGYQSPPGVLVPGALLLYRSDINLLYYTINILNKHKSQYTKTLGIHGKICRIETTYRAYFRNQNIGPKIDDE